MPRFDPCSNIDFDVLGPDPNAYPLALTAIQAAEAAVTCQFLGKTFHLNDEICYSGTVWRCTAAGWSETETQC